MDEKKEAWTPQSPWHIVGTLRPEFALSVLRKCRKSTLKDLAEMEERSTVRYVNEARASVYLFAISLIDPNSEEAKEWEEHFERSTSKIAEALAEMEQGL